MRNSRPGKPVPALEELDLQVTNRCPLSCTHCCCSSGPHGKELFSTAFIVQLLEQAATLGALEVHLTGGEPLIRNDIFEIISEARRLKLHVQLQSSGALLNDRLCMRLRELRLNLFMISLDGLERNHDQYRGCGSFQRVMDAIRRLRVAGLDVRVNTIVSRTNTDDLEAVLRLSEGLGAKAHSFFYFSPVGRGNNISDDWISPLDYMRIVAQFRNFICKNGFHERMAIYLQDGYVSASDYSTPNRIPCRADDAKFLVILADGRVLPCTWFIDTDMSLGNVNDESLPAIWEKFVKGDTFFRVDPIECQDCAVARTCRGGCQAAYYKWWKTTPSREPRCLNPLLFYPGCPEAKVRVTGGAMQLPILGRLAEQQG